MIVGTPSACLAYRTALNLNNMAIALMERGCYQQGLKTLNESLSLMKSALHKGAPTSRPQIKSEETFQNAHKRYTRCLQQTNKTNKARLEEIHLLDDNDFAGLRAAATYGPSSSVYFPVRICEAWSAPSCDDGEDEEDRYNGCSDPETDPKEIARQLGIILYNHALTNLLISKQQHQQQDASRTTTNDTHLTKALKSLEMADFTVTSVLEQQEELEEDANDDDCVNALIELSLVLLSALVLNGLSLALRQQGLQQEADETLHAVSKMCTCIEQDGFACMMTKKSMVAAAA